MVLENPMLNPTENMQDLGLRSRDDLHLNWNQAIETVLRPRQPKCRCGPRIEAIDGASNYLGVE
jgi:hypothetical protein